MPQLNADEIFKKIKKNNGERNAQKFRDLFDIPDIVDILEFAGKDEKELETIHTVLKEIYKPEEKSEVFVKQDPIALLDKAGYKAWYVEDEQEQNAIGGYFRSQKAVDYGMTGGNPRTNVGGSDNGELLCTVYQNLDYGAKRFDNYYIIHAVKKEVVGDDKLPESQWHIKPSNTPERQDRYGTSVISIQILKTGGEISIKNRYNHTVPFADSTFDNNPDNIIRGLSNSLKAHFNVDFTTSNTPLPNNFKFVHNRVVRYNFERDNIYFGPNYYVIGSDITRLISDYEYMLDYFILDARTGKVRYPGGNTWNKATFGFLKNAFEHKKIKIQTDKNQKNIFADGIYIMTVENGQIVKLDLQDTKEVGDNFFSGNNAIKTLIAPKLQKTGKDFLTWNNSLTELNLPELVDMGQYSLQTLRTLTSINTPKAKYLGSLQILHQHNLKHFYAPELSDNALDWVYQFSDNINMKMMVATNRLHKLMNKHDEKFKETIDKKIDELKQKTDKQLDDIKWKYINIGSPWKYESGID